METFNIYLSGVGGQGIGLLSEVILRAADYAGHAVKAVDTHGLAQRGGIVVSQIRLGDEAHSPLVLKHQADLIISLERHEALRALTHYAKEGGVLIYYDTVWQPLPVRLGESKEITIADIQKHCQKLGVIPIDVFKKGLEDARMQNMVLLARIEQEGLIPQLKQKHYRSAMEDLMAGQMLEKNLALLS